MLFFLFGCLFILPYVERQMRRCQEVSNVNRYRYDVSIGWFHSIFLPRISLGGQLYTYCRFVPLGSEQISSNCIYVLPNTRSIPMINI